MAKVALNMSMKTEENVMFSLCYNMYRKHIVKKDRHSYYCITKERSGTSTKENNKYFLDS